MTDRFYPLGQKADQDVWKTSYEVQNEMRSLERSPYPPGFAGHQPGAREKFGYSTPGPEAHRLSKSGLALKEDVDIPNPREHHAIPRMQVADDRETFEQHDIPEMMRSYNSPVAASTFSGSPTKSMAKSKSLSLPELNKKPMPARLSQAPAAHTALEDEHFSYFVPKSMQREHRDRLNSTTLSRLPKDLRISFPFSGDGTGFRCQSSQTDWWPKGAYGPDLPTANRAHFQHPGFHRKPMASLLS